MFRRRGEQRDVVTVLFTDIVGSTQRAADVGDRRWREVIAEHHATLRRALRNHSGREVDTAGDGFFATFERPAQAIACAIEAIAEVRRRLGIDIRAGIHAGEVERVGPKVGGIAVHIGARVLALARPGEVLVTSTVRELVGGSALRFVDRGTHELKGVPEPWHLYALEVAERTVEPTELAAADSDAGARRRPSALAGSALGVAAIAIVGIGALALVSRNPAASPSPSATAVPELVHGPDAAILLADDGSQVGGETVGSTPGDVVVGGGAVWVANLGSSTVTRIDAAGGRQRTIGGIGRPSSLAWEAGSDRLWILDGLGAKVSIVDGRDGQVVDSFRQSGRSIAIGANAVWIADEVGDAVVVIDPLSRRLVATITLPDGSAPVAVGASPDVVWVAAKGSSSVVRIDPAARTLIEGSTSVAGNPTAVAVGESIWVASGPADAVIRLDPVDGRVARTYTDVCDEPGGIEAVAGGAWATCRRSGTVLRLGPEGVGATAEVGFVPNDVAVDGSNVWVTLAAE